MKRQGRLIGAIAAVVVFSSCGDVPTLESGIAYVTPILLPSPAVAVGDTLRDSTGAVAPLRVRAYALDGAEIPGVQASFLASSLPADVTIDANGVLVASDSVRSVQIVGRIGDRLQTTPATLQIVPQPDSVERTSAEVRSTTLPALDTLRVLVTGVNAKNIRVPVPGIVVRYRVTGIHGTAIASTNAILTADGGVVIRPDSLTAVDTTDASGTAARTLVVSGSGVDSVVVHARVRDLRGRRLRGDSVHFVLRITP